MNKTTTAIIESDRETQLIVLFNLLIQTFSQVLDGFIWIVGHIGVICVCIVFYQPAFRKSPCAIYFITSSFSQFFLFNFSVFIRMIQYGYNVPVNSLSVWFCKIRYYIFYVSSANARYNIIFAGADRFLCSCREVRFRQWSSPKIALRLIVINAIVWFLFYIPVLVIFGHTNNKCRITNPNLRKIFNLYITIENGFFPIIPMLFFGLLTIRNIRRSIQRVKVTAIVDASQGVTTTRAQRKEIQLHKMLVNQIIVYLILNIPYSVYNTYRTYFLNINSESVSSALFDTFLNNFFYDLTYLGYTLSFPNFLLTSTIFRRELKQIIQKTIFCQHRQHIASVT